MSNTVNMVRKPKRGQPSKYFTAVEPYLDKIYQWIIQGYTDYSIAEQLDVDPATYSLYKGNSQLLQDLYTRAREERNKLVMNKMLVRATGEKVTLVRQKAFKDGTIVNLNEEQYVPPDPNAADLYLRNNMKGYISAKNSLLDSGTTINVFQVDDWKSKRQAILEEIKKLETQAAVDVDYLPVSDNNSTK